jgi:hypothetical protein
MPEAQKKEQVKKVSKLPALACTTAIRLDSARRHSEANLDFADAPDQRGVPAQREERGRQRDHLGVSAIPDLVNVVGSRRRDEGSQEWPQDRRRDAEC